MEQEGRFADKGAEVQNRAFSRKKAILLILSVVLLLITVTVIIVVLKVRPSSSNFPSGPKIQGSSSKHDFIRKFLVKVQESYFDCNPEAIVTKQDVKVGEILARYRPFNYNPSSLKKAADKALELRVEFAKQFTKKVESTLKPNELRVVHEMKQFLRHFGGAGPYDTSYYTGLWMLGPNTMVWEPIQTMWSWFEYIFTVKQSRPKNLAEFRHILEVMFMMKESVSNYTNNMMMGVERGMVRNIEACRAGLKSFKHFYRGFALNGEKDVLRSKFLQKYFLENINHLMKRDWKRMTGKNITSSLQEALITYIGRPFSQLIKYMETEHMRHCVPSSVSSGLANLPLTHVFKDGLPERLTHPYLPTGEQLNGSFAFKKVLAYFTTTEITPAQIQRMGYQKLNSLKAQVVALAKEVTNESNQTAAVAIFRKLLSNRSLYYNENSFPSNESQEDTFLHCHDVKSAELFCPKRFQAYKIWKNATQKVQQILHQKINAIFYSTGTKKTTLPCLADVLPTFNPTSSFHSYTPSYCGRHTLPFFIDDYGPKYSEWTVTAHETQPGHNLEVQGYSQNFKDKVNKDGITKWLSSMSYFPSFSEGWATYAEYPLVGRDLDMYRHDPLAKYGMLQQQIMGALRLIIEAGLHSFGMTRSAALQLFKENAWETGDIATKEITRYQSVQGHSVSYIFGQTAFLHGRNFAEKQLGSQFSLKEFHYQVLRQGEVPLDYLEHVIQHYVNCTMSDRKEMTNNDIASLCEDVFS